MKSIIYEYLKSLSQKLLFICFNDCYRCLFRTLANIVIDIYHIHNKHYSLDKQSKECLCKHGKEKCVNVFTKIFISGKYYSIISLQKSLLCVLIGNLQVLFHEISSYGRTILPAQNKIVGIIE